MFSALAFSVLMRTGIYPPELRAVNLDFDWSYRVLGRAVVRRGSEAVSALLALLVQARSLVLRALFAAAHRLHSPNGVMGRTWRTGRSALWMMVMLLALLVSGYLA